MTREEALKYLRPARGAQNEVQAHGACYATSRLAALLAADYGLTDAQYTTLVTRLQDHVRDVRAEAEVAGVETKQERVQRLAENGGNRHGE